MLPYVGGLPSLLDQQGGTAVPVSSRIAATAAGLAWEHRDPFDRMIAATALELGVPLVSADRAFDTLAGAGGEVARIW